MRARFAFVTALIIPTIIACGSDRAKNPSNTDMDASYTVPDAMIGPDGEIIVPDATLNQPDSSVQQEDSKVATGGEALGNGSAKLVSIYTPEAAREATDLDFDPQSGVLWVVLREYAPNDPCTASNASGCYALQGSTLQITGANTESPTSKRQMDANAWHFMRQPSSIAFGQVDDRPNATQGSSEFATCHEWRTGNYDDGEPDFIGPSLWTTDPAVYPNNGPGGNGSHLDMLHASPFCMGIAHQRAAVYWVFNGKLGSIDRYNFNEPHVPGGEDHSDGEISRYVTGELSREERVPSHMDFEPLGRFLYIADTGNKRIVRLDTTTGTASGPISPQYEELNVSATMTGAELAEVVSPGTLDLPSGLAIAGDTMYVTDQATSFIYAFDLEGNLLNQFDTGLQAGSLAGITIGPEGKAYIVDQRTSEVFRIDP